jgi:hypothetical protein
MLLSFCSFLSIMPQIQGFNYFNLHFDHDRFERKKEWHCFAGYLPRAVPEELRPRFFDLVREASKQMQRAQILQTGEFQ